MAASGSLVGVDLKTELNGSLISLTTNSSLNVSPDLREILLKSDAQGNPTDWKARLSGTQEWSVEHEGLLADSDDDFDLANSNASLEMEVDTTDDNTDNPQLVEVPLLDSIDFTLTQELAETGGIDQPLWRFIRPAEREFSIDISGTYVEPTSSNGAVYNELLEARDNGTNVPMELNVFGKTFSGDVAIGETSLEGSTGGEDAEIDISMASSGALTTTGSFGAGLDDIFSAFMGKNSVDVGMLHYGNSGPETGTLKLTGTGYYGEVSISLSSGEEITSSATVEGDGALSMGTVA